MPSDLLVIGLGYVGLPLACEASLARLRVVGFDLDEHVAAKLNSGQSHVDTVSDAAVAEMVAGGFRAITTETEIETPETIVICVPTPLSPDGVPDLTAVRGAAELVGRILRPGMLVILESTSYPGTTDEVVRPLVEKISGLNAGTDFCLAFSPERIDPGNKIYGLRNTPKVVGGYTTTCADAAASFYGKLCDEVILAKSTREAEMAKLLENTYRHINIALVNEMAIFCHELGVDLWDAINVLQPSLSGSRHSTQGLASAGTAFRSIRTTCLTRCDRSDTRSDSWNWPKRSTNGCRCSRGSGRRAT